MLFGLQTIRCEHPCLLATLAFVGAENFDLSLEIIDGRGVETGALTPPLLILLRFEIQVPGTFSREWAGNFPSPQWEAIHHGQECVCESKQHKSQATSRQPGAE